VILVDVLIFLDSRIFLGFTFAACPLCKRSFWGAMRDLSYTGAPRHSPRRTGPVGSLGNGSIVERISAVEAPKDGADRGCRIETDAGKVQGVGNSGEMVVIDGFCVSACTIVLSP
jgi:hypothetical protein